jgi:hypothetical protein
MIPEQGCVLPLLTLLLEHSQLGGVKTDLIIEATFLLLPAKGPLVHTQLQNLPLAIFLCDPLLKLVLPHPSDLAKSDSLSFPCYLWLFSGPSLHPTLFCFLRRPWDSLAVSYLETLDPDRAGTCVSSLHVSRTLLSAWHRVGTQ